MVFKGIFPRRNETTIINEAGVELNIDASGILAMTGTVTFPSAQSVVFDSAQDVNVSFPAVQTIDFDGVQSVQFDATQNVNISSTTGNVDVEIKNVAAISVDASGSTVPISVAGTVTVDASGATVPVSVAGSVTVDASGATVPISVAGTVTVDASGNTVPISFSGTQDVNIASTTGALDVAFDGTQNVNITAGTCDVDIQNSSIDIFSTSSNIEQHKVSVTNSSTTQNWTNAIKSFLFYNDGSEDVHINFGGAATTNHLKIVKGASFSLDYATQDTRFITASGTATVYAIGVW